MSLLAFLGRYRVRLLPLLPFESLWKRLWLAAVALPRATGDLNGATMDVVFRCSLVVLVLAVTPWTYVWRHCVHALGDPWR
jgi:hypothetical protein